MTRPKQSNIEERLTRNLRRITDYVDSASQETAVSSHEASTQTLGQQIARYLPLSHATGRATLLGVLEQDRLLSPLKLAEQGFQVHAAGAGPSVEATLETDDSVFTYAAPFRYPETSCGLLFKTELERKRSDHAVATPFDSGATIDYLRPNDSTKNQIAFVRFHELPVPDYRVLLGKLLDHFFTSSWNYVEGTDPIDSWPIPVQGGDWRRWTFEVRFRDEIRLTGSLLAIFLPVAVASEQTVVRQVARWRQDGVHVKLFRSPNVDDWHTLRDLSIEYFKNYLGGKDDGAELQLGRS